jgi:hypothetical protein
MKRKISLVEPLEGEDFYVYSSDIKDGAIASTEWDMEDNSYTVWTKVEVVKELEVHIQVHFLLQPDGSPKYVSGGDMRAINRLSYMYQILILEPCSDYKTYDQDVMYKDSGIGTTNGDMYSYHTIEEGKTTYQTGSIEWDILTTLDYTSIL